MLRDVLTTVHPWYVDINPPRERRDRGLRFGPKLLSLGFENIGTGLQFASLPSLALGCGLNDGIANALWAAQDALRFIGIPQMRMTILI